jgi:hypothetical protein
MPVIAITLADPAAVAASEKGVLGEFAGLVAPNYTARQVYQGVADGVQQQLAARGISATVTVLDSVDGEPQSSGPSVRDLFPVAVGAAAAYLLLRKD